jgi:hypothetical protein
MASQTTGNVFPTAGASVDRAGATAWTGPGNVTSDNGTGATTTVPTDYLITSGYSFTAISNTAVILGVTVRFEVTETGSGSSNLIPQLSSNTTPTLIGAAKSAVAVTLGPTVYTSGANNDLWSATLTPEIVKNAGFGVTFWSTDTINALDVDYVTIAIEWAEQAPWLSGRETFRWRKNFTNRRLRSVQQLSDSPSPSVPTSADRALEVNFRTVTLRSRHVQSIGWIAAIASKTPSPAAWLAPVVAIRRRETERYTPPVTAWREPARVIRVEFVRKLQEQAAQIEFPPTTGPPAENVGRALESDFSTSLTRSRRLQLSPDAPVYPATPVSAVPAPAFASRVVRRRKSRQGLLLPAGEIVSTVVAEEPAATPAGRVESGGFSTRPVCSRRLQLLPEVPVYPATPAAETSDDRTLAVPFRTLTSRSRRHLKTTPVLGVSAATPPVAQPVFDPVKTKRRKKRQGLFLSGGGVVEAKLHPTVPSYFARPTKKRKSLERRLQRLPGVPSTTAAAAAVPPVTAWQRPKQNRVERDRALQRLPLRAYFPSFAALGAWTRPKALKRRETARTLRSVMHAPLHTFYAELTGTTSLTFTPVGAFTGSAALVGVAAWTFTPTATLTGDGALSGTAGISFTPTGALTGSGALVGVTSVTFSPVATLQGSGALAGSTALSFTVAGNLADYSAGQTTGTASLTFGASALFTGGMAGTASVQFTPTATLQGAGELSGTSSLSFTPAAVFSAEGALAGDTGLSFTLTGTLVDGTVNIIGSTATVTQVRGYSATMTEVLGNSCTVENVLGKQGTID